MNLKQRLDWIRSHLDFFIDIIRVYLGVGLFFKGLFLVAHGDQLRYLADNTISDETVQAVAYIHMIGGAMLALGIFTRVAALVQLPAIVGALVAVNLPGMIGMGSREGAEFTALVLFLMILFVLKGPGKLALVKGRIPAFAQDYQRWVDAHPDFFFDIIRAYLGLALFVKGVYLSQNPSELAEALDDPDKQSGLLSLIAHSIAPIHLAGGLLLAAGFLTRLAAGVQALLLAGALFYVYLPNFTRFSWLLQRQEIEFTALVLFLLVLFTVHGAGRYSVDRRLRDRRRIPPATVPVSGPAGTTP